MESINFVKTWSIIIAAVIQSAKKETQQQPGLPALVQDTAHLGALVFRPRVLLPISFNQPR